MSARDDHHPGATEESPPSPAEPAAPPGAASGIITPGSRVELVGIQSKPELNGTQGVVVQFIGAEGRFQVRLDGANSTMHALWPECLRLVSRHTPGVEAPAPPVEALARRLCLAAHTADRPDDAAAALARLGRILRDGAADPARRNLKSGSAAFEAKLGSLGLADVVAFLEVAGFTAAVSKEGVANMVLKLTAVDACSAAAKVLHDVERGIAVAAADALSSGGPVADVPLPPAPPLEPQLEQPKAPPPPSAPGGGCPFFATARIPLAAVGHIDSRCFDVLAVHSIDKSPAERDVKYWGGAKNKDTGAEEPWRNGTTDAPITDPTVIAREEVAKRGAEAEDAARCPTVEAHGAMLHGLALRADFLVAFTFTLNTWSWRTWEVMDSFYACRAWQLADASRMRNPSFISFCPSSLSGGAVPDKASDRG